MHDEQAAAIERVQVSFERFLGDEFLGRGDAVGGSLDNEQPVERPRSLVS